MIITEIQYFFSKIIRFQAIFKDTVEFTCALEFKISSQLYFANGCKNAPAAAKSRARAFVFHNITLFYFVFHASMFHSPECAGARGQIAAAAKVMRLAGDQIHRGAAAGVEIRVVGLP